MNTDSNAFSALVELFGHRDLAADSPEDFHRQTTTFRETLRVAIANQGYPKANCLMLLDKCLLWHNSAVKLLDLLTELRSRLLRSGEEGATTLLLRGLVFPKQVKVDMVTSSQRPGVPGLMLDPSAWELFGRVESFKGVGIWIDDAVFETSASSVSDRSEIRKRVFSNYYVPSASEPRFARFPDLRFAAADLDYQAAANTVGLIREAYHRSRKLSRFFVPLLVNWIQHMELAKKPQPENPEGTGLGLDWFLARGDFSLLRRVMGAELVFAKLIERVYPEQEARIHCHRERWALLNDHLVNKSRWLLTILQSDDKGIRIPEDILKRTNRRAFAHALAQKTPKRGTAADGSLEESED